MRLLAVLGLSIPLAGCDPATVTMAGVLIDIGLHGYQLSSQITSGLAQGIEIQCRALVAKEAKLEAEGKQDKVNEVERWSGASVFCNPANPPPHDPIAAAFWLGTVIASL